MSGDGCAVCTGVQRITRADGDRVEGYMASVIHIGKEYGLQLNWNEVEALPCRMNVHITSPFGENIQCKSSMVYLEVQGQKVKSDRAQ